MNPESGHKISGRMLWADAILAARSLTVPNYLPNGVAGKDTPTNREAESIAIPSAMVFQIQKMCRILYTIRPVLGLWRFL